MLHLIEYPIKRCCSGKGADPLRGCRVLVGGLWVWLSSGLTSCRRSGPLGQAPFRATSLHNCALPLDRIQGQCSLTSRVSRRAMGLSLHIALTIC